MAEPADHAVRAAAYAELVRTRDAYDLAREQSQAAPAIQHAYEQYDHASLSFLDAVEKDPHLA